MYLDPLEVTHEGHEADVHSPRVQYLKTKKSLILSNNLTRFASFMLAEKISHACYIGTFLLRISWSYGHISYVAEKCSMLCDVMELCACFCKEEAALLWWSKHGPGRQEIRARILALSLTCFGMTRHFTLRSSVKCIATGLTTFCRNEL